MLEWQYLSRWAYPIHYVFWKLLLALYTNKGRAQLSYEVSRPLSMAATVHSVCFIAVFITSALVTRHVLQFWDRNLACCKIHRASFVSLMKILVPGTSFPVLIPWCPFILIFLSYLWVEGKWTLCCFYTLFVFRKENVKAENLSCIVFPYQVSLGKIFLTPGISLGSQPSHIRTCAPHCNFWVKESQGNELIKKKSQGSSKKQSKERWKDLLWVSRCVRSVRSVAAVEK